MPMTIPAFSPETHIESDGRGTEEFVIWPHRSLSRNGTRLLLGGTAAIFLVVAVKAAMLGAWPQAIYVMLAVGGLAVALSSNTRSARFAQVIELAPDAVRVRMFGPAARTSAVAEFNPSWIRVIEAPGPYNDIRLLLRQSGRSVAIGEFLSPEERVKLAEELRTRIAKRYITAD